jgi:hypothetical protein
VKVDGGYELLTREAAFFEDLRSGEILEKWITPSLKKNKKSYKSGTIRLINALCS